MPAIAESGLVRTPDDELALAASGAAAAACDSAEAWTGGGAETLPARIASTSSKSFVLFGSAAACCSTGLVAALAISAGIAPSGGLTNTIPPHFGQGTSCPIAPAPRTFSRDLQVVQVIVKGSTVGE